MTLSATPALAGPFDGNGIADEFSFDFKVFNASDLLVVKFSVLDVESTLVNGVDYTVTLNSDQDANPGGIVLHPVSGTKLATGERLTITTQLAIEQSTDLTNQGLFYPQTVETMVDRVVALVRQVEASSARAVQLPLSLADSDPSLPTPVPGAALMWNETGDAIINGIMTESLVALSSFMANVIQAADAAEARGDLGVTLGNLGVSAFAQTILDDANAAAVRTTIDAASATGTTTNDNAAAGEVGEVIEGELVSGSATALTTATPKDVISIALTAGDWDVDALIGFTIVNTTTIWQSSISQTSATLNAKNRDYRRVGAAGNLIGVYEAAVPSARISLAAPATIYLVAEAIFASGSNAAYGWLRARRMR